MICEAIKAANNILLVEPTFPRKYPPLSLMKISAYAKQHGKKTTYVREVLQQDLFSSVKYDLICITSLFTYDAELVIETAKKARFIHPKSRVIVGGVFATLMPEMIKKVDGVEVYTGYSQELDLVVPDYSLPIVVDEPWDTFSFLFTSRGCPNKCAYCVVPRIEKEAWVNPNWKDLINLSKPNVMISDNNLSSAPMEHIQAVCSYLKEKKLHVVFDNGFDCKHITDEFAEALAGLKFVRSGLRMAFDRIEEDGIFQKAIGILQKHNVGKGQTMAYCLYNFLDIPKEADYRMRECVKLDVRPYPQQYRPLNHTDRKSVFVSKNWTLPLLHAFRYFWLMAGIYGKHEFIDWAREQDQFPLGKEDFEAWERTESAYPKGSK